MCSHPSGETWARNSTSRRAGRQLVLAGIRGELAQDLARPHRPGGHGGRHAQDVRPVPVDRREGHGRGTRRGDREPSRMGGSGRPRRNGCRPGEHGRVGSVEPCVGGLQPLPALHAAHAAHAGHRGVARGQALAGRRRRPAQQRPGAADRLPAAEFEVEPAAARPTRSPPVGDGGVIPPARCVPRRRRLAGAIAPLRRYQKDAAVSPRRR